MSIVLGVLSSVKIYFPAIILAFVTLLFFIIAQKNIKKVLFNFFILVAFAFLTYTASYLGYFLQGNSFRNFLGTQKWIFLFWKNNSIQVSKYYGSIIPLILFNQWKVWWGNKQYINFVHWSVFWPTFFILGIISTYSFLHKEFLLLLKNKKIPNLNDSMRFFCFFLSVWVILFTIYLCLIPISPRYLMMLYFPMYILILLFIKIKFNKYV